MLDSKTGAMVDYLFVHRGRRIAGDYLNRSLIPILCTKACLPPAYALGRVPHRMACAKCAFYVPKESTRAQAVEAKVSLVRMLQEIPLLDEERAAVEDGVAAMTKLTNGLRDVATPDGRPPAEIAVSLRGDASPLSETKRGCYPQSKRGGRRRDSYGRAT